MNDPVSVRMLISEDSRVQSKELDCRIEEFRGAAAELDFRENQPEVCPE